ncbi:hypothetical protein [Streptomyces sp. SD15]
MVHLSRDGWWCTWGATGRSRTRRNAALVIAWPQQSRSTATAALVRAAASPLGNPTSSALTQKQLGRHPEQPGLVPDLEAGHYFSEQAHSE